MHMNFSDQIRSAVRRSGITRYRIASEAGVDEASLCRFLQGSGVTTTTLDALAKVLRLSVASKGPSKHLLKKYRT